MSGWSILSIGSSRRIHDFKMLNICLTQFLADHLRQRIIDRFPDIRDLQLRGIELIRCPHTGDDWDMKLMTTLDKVELGRDSVDTVHDIVVMGEVERIRVGGKIKRLIFPHMTTGIDVVDTILCHIHLMTSHTGDRSKDLAVDIRQTDLVIIYDIECANTATRQYLNDIATNASHAKDSDTGAVERVYSRLAQQQLCA